MTSPHASAPSERDPLLVPGEVDAFPEGDIETAEEQADLDGPKQSVGTLRAVLIILSLWVLIFLQGRISQLFSPRICISISAVLFGIGSFVTSRAQSFQVFITGRAIAGVGAAGVMTISIILVLELTGKKRRGLFIGLVNAGYTSGVALGAVVAGALLPVTGWRALFWIQTPLAIGAGIAVFFSIPHSFVSNSESPDDRSLRKKLAKVDYLGAITLILTIVLFLYGLSSAKIQWIPVGVSAILLIIFILNEVYIAHTPIIPITVLSSRGVLLTCVAQLGFMGARWTVLFYTPVYAIAVRGWSPSAAGSVLVPTNLGFAAGGLLAGALHIRRGGSFYLPCIITFAMFTITEFAISQVSTDGFSTVGYIAIVFLNGLFTGAALNYTLAHILHLSLPSVHFIVSSLLATFRGFAGSFGSAIGSGIFQRLLRGSLERGFEAEGMQKEELIRKLLGSPAMVSGLEGLEKMIAVEGYEYALKGLFLSATAGAALIVLVQAGAGWKEPEIAKTAEEEEE
ncbi:MAG: hypothetical protein M1818_002740 [Claussenomyces sp. TS43310]|nr:MAG: hypothetical protein M1818_002740 [Claussenomyces sp. TS43310]